MTLIMELFCDKMAKKLKVEELIDMLQDNRVTSAMASLLFTQLTPLIKSLYNPFPPELYFSEP